MDWLFEASDGTLIAIIGASLFAITWHLYVRFLGYVLSSATGGFLRGVPMGCLAWERRITAEAPALWRDPKSREPA